MDGSGGQGSIAWYIVVLCLSSQWALTLVMYVLLGNYRVWELLPVTQEVSAHAGWHLAPLLCSTAKPAQVTMLAIPFPFQNCFFLFASWWVALLCNKPTNLLCRCVSHLPSGTAGLWPTCRFWQCCLWLARLHGVQNGSRDADMLQGACRGGSNAEHTAGGQCSCLVGLGSCCWKLHL